MLGIELEPSGLVYEYNERTGLKPGRVVFVPPQTSRKSSRSLGRVDRKPRWVRHSGSASRASEWC
jgi:hypothetical protein